MQSGVNILLLIDFPLLRTGMFYYGESQRHCGVEMTRKHVQDRINEIRE